MDGWHLVFVAATFGLAGLVKGTIGLGLPTVAMGLLGLVMPASQAAALLVVPSLATNAWQLLAGPGFGGLLRRLWPLLLGIAAGTALVSRFRSSQANYRATSRCFRGLLVPEIRRRISGAGH